MNLHRIKPDTSSELNYRDDPSAHHVGNCPLGHSKVICDLLAIKQTLSLMLLGKLICSMHTLAQTCFFITKEETLKGLFPSLPQLLRFMVQESGKSGESALFPSEISSLSYRPTPYEFRVSLTQVNALIQSVMPNV